MWIIDGGGVRVNHVSADFFRSQEFKATRVLRGYYEDSGEDAFLMQYRLADDPGEDLDEPINRIAQYEEN